MNAKTNRIDLASTLPFAAMHAACLLVFWTGASTAAVAACGICYFVRMFAITGGYHRYFSHSSYKTSRPFQFVLAWLGASAAQKGPLWWASHHRQHHAASDTEDDVHSPLTQGFWWAHLGWIFSHRYDDVNWKLIRGFARYRELRWLDRYHLVPPAALALALMAVGEAFALKLPESGVNAFQMLVWGFFVSTVLLYHATFTVNSLAHIFGDRRYATSDGSRNNLWISLITLGEGWHNNHHFAPGSERQGFFWWEIDITHYILAGLSRLGLVWDLRRPPDRAYANTTRIINQTKIIGGQSI